MVVMRLAAKPVAELTTVVGERVHDTFLAQQRERPVDRRKPDRRFVPRTEALPQRLRGRVVGLDCQLEKHLDSPPRGLYAMPCKQIREALRRRLRRFHDERTIADVITRIILTRVSLRFT